MTFVLSAITLVLTILPSGLSGSLLQAGDGRVKKVLILGIDGCRPDALLKAKAPNLQQLIETGAFSAQAQTGDVTVSGPGWTSMLTGVWRDKHGVRDNGFENANLKQYPHFFRRLKQARPKAYTASVVHWAPIATKIVVDADVSLAHKQDAKVAEDAAKILRERDPEVLFVHLDDVDGAGHKFGFHPEAPQYVKAIEQADRHVGLVLEALRERKTFAQEDWLILASTDHGGSGKGHGQNTPEHRTIFLIVSGPSARRGAIEPPPAIVDVAVTALVHLGVTIEPAWKLDGKAVGLK